MNISLKPLLVSAAVAMFVTSCGTATDSSQGGITRAVGDAAVDKATENTDPLTGAAIRQSTGYGTDPVEKAKTDALSKLGF